MKAEEIKEPLKKFEEAAQEVEGIGCWSAKDLQTLLGYAQWHNFEFVIQKAKVSCSSVGENIAYHFADVSKTIPMPKSTEKQVDDLLLTRYACYLIAQNGDNRKGKISFAQIYFAVQTHKAEIVEQRLLEYERVRAREKLSQTRKQLSGILYERGVDDKEFAITHSKDDQALFNLTTVQLKRKIGTSDNRPAADLLPTISIKAKDLAAEITNVNVVGKDLKGMSPIQKEHIDNNTAVRNMPVDRSIVPEQLLPAEDTKKIQHKFNKEEKKLLKSIQLNPFLTTNN